MYFFTIYLSLFLASIRSGVGTDRYICFAHLVFISAHPKLNKREEKKHPNEPSIKKMFFFSFVTHKATSRRFNIFEINNVWIEDVCDVIRMNEMCAIISSADLVLLLLLVLLSVVNLYHTTDTRTHTAAINKKKKFRVSVLSVWIVRSNWRQTPPKCLCACVFACTSLIFTQMRKERLIFLSHLRLTSYLFVQSFCILKKYAKLWSKNFVLQDCYCCGCFFGIFNDCMTGTNEIAGLAKNKTNENHFHMYVLQYKSKCRSHQHIWCVCVYVLPRYTFKMNSMAWHICKIGFLLVYTIPCMQRMFFIYHAHCPCWPYSPRKSDKNFREKKQLRNFAWQLHCWWLRWHDYLYLEVFILTLETVDSLYSYLLCLVRTVDIA